MKIVFEGEFTDANTYIDAERRSRYTAADIKEMETYRAKLATLRTREALPRVPHSFTFHWYCKDKKKDPDNIAFAHKFILDGLTAGGIIQTDGWAVVGELHDKFYVDKQRPRVEVEVEPINVGNIEAR